MTLSEGGTWWHMNLDQAHGHAMRVQGCHQTLPELFDRDPVFQPQNYRRQKGGTKKRKDKNAGLPVAIRVFLEALWCGA